MARSRKIAHQPTSTWLQSFNRRKVLAYFLVQLFTFGLLSAYPLSLLALVSVSVAMPFAIEISVKLSAFILKGFASLFTRNTRQANTPRAATLNDFNEISRALTLGDRRLALNLFNRVTINNPVWLHALCASAIRCNASEVFERIIALRVFATHFADNDNQLLQLASNHGRVTMVNTLLLNQSVCRQAHAGNNRILQVACRVGSLPIVEALLRLDNVQNQLINDSDDCYYAARDVEIRERLLRVPLLRNRYHGPRFLWNHNATPNLQNLANNPESAVAELNPQHQQQLANFQRRYSAALNSRGVENIMNDIRAFLIENYRQNPVMHNDIALPLEYNPTLPPAVQALYYASKAHTAYRYLCVPNPWIDPTADYIQPHPDGGASARIGQSEKITMASLWLAMCDTTMPAPEGMTHADLKKLFAETILAGAGRGHNYDNAVLNQRAGREIDDGRADNPTCGTGASRWISQFLTLLVTDPSSRALNCNILRAKCRDILLAEGNNSNTVFAKLNRLDKATLSATKTALETLISEHAGDMRALQENERHLLRAIEPSQTAISAMVQECKDYFSAERITARNGERIDFEGTRYQSYEDMLQFMGTHLVQTFGDEIRTKMIELEKPNQRKRKRAA